MTTTATTLYSWWGFMYGLMMGSLIWKCGSCFEFEHSQPLPLQDWNNNVTFKAAAAFAPPLMVGLTLVDAAASKGAVCLDGSLPGYHIHRGYGSGANSWLIQLEGGGWCNSITKCVFSKKTRHGSSHYMEKQIPFEGILSNKAEENPDFYNWNRVKVRYCDGGSFSGDSQNEAAQLYFRGQRIWSAVMEDLMSKGMRYANQALLSGCSAGGLASILHCDEFRHLFPRTARVKCLSDAGLFLDVLDISGWRTLRYMFAGVVRLQGMQKNLPRGCAKRFNPIMCFFPQRLIASVRTPLFLVNTAYDTWQELGIITKHLTHLLKFFSHTAYNAQACTHWPVDFPPPVYSTLPWPSPASNKKIGFSKKKKKEETGGLGMRSFVLALVSVPATSVSCLEERRRRLGKSVYLFMCVHVWLWFVQTEKIRSEWEKIFQRIYCRQMVKLGLKRRLKKLLFPASRKMAF